VEDEGASYIFVGPNDGGKTTIALNTGRKVLSDDCVGIRKTSSGFLGCSTPWGSVHANSEHPLGALFFIKKSDRLFFNAISPIEVIKRIFSNTSLSFPDFNEKCSEPILEHVLGIITELSAGVPVFELEFRKEDNVMDFIRERRQSWNSADCIKQ